MDEQVLQLMAEFNAKLEALAPKMAATAGTRDPEDEMLIRLLVGNLVMTAQLYYGRRKPRVAKFAMLLNRDINAHWEEYMQELYGPLPG